MTDINKLIERRVPSLISEGYAVLREAMDGKQGDTSTWTKISPEEARQVRSDLYEARTALQTLKEENERLRKALEPFAEAWDAEEYLCSSHWSSFYEASQILRASLPKETDNGR
ncbi:hypothetical protein [Novosphingobium sp. KN65.2]|uniref:hypothetical protein n=1 Tax=Novosphingobium sp. KN65.2 TaxID=1478134 RepID=UPI0005DEEE2F|nr:hypothetical protein [Novosphingobium sp. KN65.2]CDO34653.1 hypothetical protein SPHV1_1750005 [Novosphingobium sp. KN65.2]